MIIKYKNKAISTKKLARLTILEVHSYFYKDTFRFLVETICLLTADNILTYRKTEMSKLNIIQMRRLTSHITQLNKIQKLLHELVLYNYQFITAKNNNGKQHNRSRKYIFTSKDLREDYPPRDIQPLKI